MRTLAPHPTLAPFVRDVMIVEVGDEIRRLRMPEPGLVLAVRYRGFASIRGSNEEKRIPDVCLTGMTLRAREMRTSANGGVVLVRFRPGGAARFFAAPLHELLGASVALSDVAPGAGVARLHDRVRAAPEDGERARAVEAFLFAQQRDHTDPIVATAVRHLSEANGIERTTVGALAASAGLSLDAFEKRFRRVVGCSPKQFALQSRLRRAIDSYHPGVSLTQLALDAGYYDQAHFNRDLRTVTGKAPGELFQLLDLHGAKRSVEHARRREPSTAEARAPRRPARRSPPAS